MKFIDENLLQHLQRPEFKQLCSVLATRRYPKNSFVCQADSSENMIFIVKKGRVRVYLGFEEKEFNLAILGKGDIYSTHTGTFVQAIDNTELLVADVQTFRQQMIDDQDVAKAMIRVLGKMLKSSFAIIDGLVFKDAGCRLIGLLATEARRHGREQGEGKGIVVDIDLTVEQIAQLVGASRQTVSTLLNKLIRSGLLIRLSRGTYLVPNIGVLETMYRNGDCLQ